KQSPAAIVPLYGGALVGVPSRQQTCTVALVASTTKPSPALSDWIIESWRLEWRVLIIEQTLHGKCCYATIGRSNLRCLKCPHSIPNNTSRFRNSGLARL